MTEPITESNWHQFAACANIGGDFWFPEHGDMHSAYQAKKICATCPVSNLCAEYAVVNGIIEGIWGGMGGRQRRALRA